MFKLTEYANDRPWHFSFQIMNHHECYDTDKTCVFHIALFNHSWWWEIPLLFKPKKVWVDTRNLKYKDKIADGYWNYIPREYGFSAYYEALHIYYGIQPGQWSKSDPKNSDHSKCYFIPWNSFRRVRYDFYNLDGSFFGSAPDVNGRIAWKNLERMRETAPKIKFKFKDFDGEENTATCYIEEMEWRRGTGWFKWLGWICKPNICRFLDITFEKEVGYNKGSWKGGTMGHSITMEKGESPIAAFKRYGVEEERYRHHGIKNRNFADIEVMGN